MRPIMLRGEIDWDQTPYPSLVMEKEGSQPVLHPSSILEYLQAFRFRLVHTDG